MLQQFASSRFYSFVKVIDTRIKVMTCCDVLVCLLLVDMGNLQVKSIDPHCRTAFFSSVVLLEPTLYLSGATGAYFAVPPFFLSSAAFLFERCCWHLLSSAVFLFSGATLLFMVFFVVIVR